MGIPFKNFIPAIVWFTLVTILLTLPGSDIPKISALDYIHFDKIVHIGLFGALVFFSYFPFSVSNLSTAEKRKILLKIAFAALFYGIAMEFVQKYFIPGRSFDIDDMIADGSGGFIAYFLQKTMDKIFFFTKKRQVV